MDANRDFARIKPMGLRLNAVAAGIRKQSRPDVALLELAEDSSVAAAFTRNAFAAAPVLVSKRHLNCARPRYLLVNSGNANAGMGERGERDALRCCESLAALAGVARESVLVFSTGVIGEALPVEKIIKSLPALWRGLGTDHWLTTAKSIMTTDTYPKCSVRHCETSAGEVQVCGIAKGSGMIHPDMATMLAFVVVDARVPKTVLDQWLPGCLDNSFHRITVDGDTSTNDSCVLVATAAGDALDEADLESLREAVMAVFVDLSRQIVEDGEGVTRPFSVSVRQGHSTEECLRVAHSVGGSQLVKTAIHARDPNWGRLLAAVGYAGVADLDISKVSISFNEVPLVAHGARVPGYDEAKAQQAMHAEQLNIVVCLGRGAHDASIYASDLSAEYVRVNAEYRS